MAARKGRMETMSNHGSGWIRLEFVVPARGLIGFRTRFLTETRGTGIASSIAEGYAPWQGAIEQRLTGSLVADRAGQATPYAMTNLQERGSFIVEPSSEVEKVFAAQQVEKLHLSKRFLLLKLSISKTHPSFP